MLAVWYELKAPTEVQQVGEMPDHEPAAADSDLAWVRDSRQVRLHCLTESPHLVSGLDQRLLARLERVPRSRQSE